MGILNLIVELLDDRKIFVRQGIRHEIKIIALLVYHADLIKKVPTINVHKNSTHILPRHQLGLRLPFRVRVGETVVVLQELQENI